MEAEALKDGLESGQAKLPNGNENPAILKREWFGVALVVAVAVLPDFFNALNSYLEIGEVPQAPTERQTSFSTLMLGLIFRSAYACTFTVLAILCLGNRWQAAGFTRFRLRDIFWIPVIYLVSVPVYSTAMWLLPDHWFRAYPKTPATLSVL